MEKDSHLILDPSCIFKEGLLKKSPPLSEASIIRKQWRMRWCVLYDTKAVADVCPQVKREVCLFYYEKEKDKKAGKKPKGKIMLHHVDVSKYRGKLHGNDFVINIQTQDRLYHICSAQPFTYDEWYTAIREHCIPNETEAGIDVPLNDATTMENSSVSPAYRSFDQYSPNRSPDVISFFDSGRRGPRVSLPANVTPAIARPRSTTDIIHDMCTPPCSPRRVPDTNFEDDDYLSVDNNTLHQVRRAQTVKGEQSDYVTMHKYKYRSEKQKNFDFGIDEESATNFTVMKRSSSPHSDDHDPDYMKMSGIVPPDESHPKSDYMGMDGIFPPDESEPVYFGMGGTPIINKNFNTARRHKDASCVDTDSDYMAMGIDPLLLKNDIARRRLLPSEEQGFITNLDSDTDSGIGRTDSESSNYSNMMSRSSISSSGRSKSNSFDSLPGFIGPRLSASSTDPKRFRLPKLEVVHDYTPNDQHSMISRNVTMRNERNNNKITGDRLTKSKSVVELRNLSLEETDDTGLQRRSSTVTTDQIPNWNRTINFECKF